MKILERFRNRSPREPDDGESPEESGADDHQDQLPIARYDGLNAKQVVPPLTQLSQTDLGVVEEHERSHQGRSAVLNKLRWLRGPEPFEGYDALDTQAIVQTLSGANAETLRVVRDYERHHQARYEVIAEVARVLPNASPSAGEERAREEKAERLREGHAMRATTVSDSAE